MTLPQLCAPRLLHLLHAPRHLAAHLLQERRLLQPEPPQISRRCGTWGSCGARGGLRRSGLGRAGHPGAAPRPTPPADGHRRSRHRSRPSRAPRPAPPSRNGGRLAAKSRAPVRFGRAGWPFAPMGAPKTPLCEVSRGGSGEAAVRRAELHVDVQHLLLGEGNGAAYRASSSSAPPRPIPRWNRLGASYTIGKTAELGDEAESGAEPQPVLSSSMYQSSRPIDLTGHTCNGSHRS